MQDMDGDAVEVALGGGWRVRTRLPGDEVNMGLLSRIIPGS